MFNQPQPLNIMARPAPDCLPHPMSSLITGITPQQALEQGLPEAEFIARVLAELAQPGTCGVGYNSLRFDDEVTRNTLYRNLHDPYGREWQNGNSRWDMIDVVRICHDLRHQRCTRHAPRNGFRFKHKLFSLDGSILNASMKLFPWADYNRKKVAFKLYVGLDHDGLVPCFAQVLLCEGAMLAAPATDADNHPRPRASQGRIAHGKA